MPQGAQDIRRIEARGGVTVISKDQNASGDLGVYDLKTKTITLTGNVVVSQGKNVLHGERVVVDTVDRQRPFRYRAQASRQNRVRALILPSKGANGGGPSNIMSIGPAPRRIEGHAAVEHRRGKSDKTCLEGGSLPRFRSEPSEAGRRDRHFLIFSPPTRRGAAPAASAGGCHRPLPAWAGRSTAPISISRAGRRQSEKARSRPSAAARGGRRRKMRRSVSRQPESAAACRRPRPRRRTDGNGAAPPERKGVLAVHGVEKSFVGRKVVKA